MKVVKILPLKYAGSVGQLAYILYILLLSNSLSLQAQSQKTFQWVEQLGGKSWDISGGLGFGSKNNLFVTGSFIDTLSCNEKKVISSGSRDFFIARFDTKGNLKDLQSGGGKENDQATCIIPGINEGIILGGIISGDVTFDKLTSSGEGPRLFVTSMSEKSKYEWIATLIPQGEASLFLIDTDAKGNIIASGTFSGSLIGDKHTITSSGRKDIFLVKINTVGTIEKLISIGGEEDDLPDALSVSDSGKIVLAATTGKAFSIGELEINTGKKTTGSKAKSFAFLVGFDNEFQPLWKTQLKADEYCQISSLQQDANENLYACGSYNLSMQVEDTLLTSLGYSDGFLLRYTSEGKLSWIRSFGSWYYDRARYLVTDNLGGTIVTGSMGDTLIIDSLIIAPASTNSSALAIQFSQEGKATWADCISGSGRNFGDGTAIDREGNLYLTGTFRDEFIKGNSTLKSQGDQDVFLARYNNCPTEKAEITGDTLICPEAFTQLSIKHGYNQVVWNDTIENTNYIIAQAAGRYTVRMLDKQGCVLVDTIEVTLASPQSFSLGEDCMVPIGESKLLKAPESLTGYQWQDGSNKDTYLAEAKTEKPGTFTYWLMATDSLGCAVTDTINIRFYLSPGWGDLSNVSLNLYPNPVGETLYWSISNREPCQVIVEIVDENGKIVYYRHEKNYQPGTEESVDFSEVPAGSYFFRLKNNAGKTFNSVCIIRK